MNTVETREHAAIINHPFFLDQIKTEDSANIETERCNAVHEKVHSLRDLLRQLQSGTLPGYLSK